MYDDASIVTDGPHPPLRTAPTRLLQRCTCIKGSILWPTCRPSSVVSRPKCFTWRLATPVATPWIGTPMTVICCCYHARVGYSCRPKAARLLTFRPGCFPLCRQTLHTQPKRLRGGRNI